jgi:hypothetical protein
MNDEFPTKEELNSKIKKSTKFRKWREVQFGGIILYTTIVSLRYAQLGKEYLAENTCTFTIKHLYTVKF